MMYFNELEELGNLDIAQVRGGCECICLEGNKERKIGRAASIPECISDCKAIGMKFEKCY